jgi:hypothetical protein
LATFVAPVEQRFATHDAARNERGQHRRFAVVLVSCVTVFALGVSGYHPYAEDGGLYLAGVERLLDPGLFAHNAAFVLEPTRYSLFAATVAAVVRVSHFDLPVVFFGLHLASIWMMLLATWMLACRCWPERAARAGAVVLVACWFSLPVAGTALALMDPYLTARSISTPCMVFALVGMLDATESTGFGAASTNRICGALLWLVSIALAAVMHPLMAGYAFAATLFLACARSRRPGIRVWGSVALGAAAPGIAECLNFTARPETAAYRHIALTRMYWFPAEWSWYEVLGLIAPLIILAVFAMQFSARAASQEETGATHPLCCAAIAAGASAWLVATCLARPDSSAYLVARLQPLRIFQFVYFVMALVLGAMLGSSLLRDRTSRWVGTLLVLGGIMLVANRRAFSNSYHLELPGNVSHNAWVEAFLWIKGNTPKNAVFALDPDYINASGEDAQCFRAIAERSALPDYSKDGGEASIAPELTGAWTAGQQAQQGLNVPSTTDAMRIAVLRPAAVTWVVLDAYISTRLDCPYTNSAVRVCRLP